MYVGLFSFIGLVLGAQKMPELIDKTRGPVRQEGWYIIGMVIHEHILMLLRRQ